MRGAFATVHLVKPNYYSVVPTYLNCPLQIRQCWTILASFGDYYTLKGRVQWSIAVTIRAVKSKQLGCIYMALYVYTTTHVLVGMYT